MASPKVPNAKIPNAKVRIEDVITKDGKLDSDKFWKLSEAQIADLVGDAIHDIRAYIVQPTTYAKMEPSIRLLDALDKESPDLGLGRYVTLYKSMATDDGSALTKSYLDDLKQYDPDTFNLYLDNAGWEVFTMPKDFDFKAYKAENKPKNAEPSVGAFTDKPLNNVSPAETPLGALTNPPTKLPEATPEGVTGTELNSAPASSELPKKVTIIRNPVDNAELVELANKGPERTYKDRVGSTTLGSEDKPVFLTDKGGSLPKEGVVVGPETSKPGIDTPLAEENPAATSSPEVKAAEAEAAKTETAANTPEVKTPETAENGGALTGKDGEKPAEPSKGMFKKMLGWVHNHPKISWGVGGTTALGILGGIGITQADKIAKALKAGEDLDRNAGEESESPEVFDNVNYRVWENYTPDYLNEEYVPGKIPSHIPQDRLIKESTTSKKVKSQPQVVNAPAPVNNATADYVRAAYNSYIPSDAGRAYQKAIYGDPLELDRMRLQQQQQKWRDFVMRSGQSPAELVQRGLMPYDALQYI